MALLLLVSLAMPIQGAETKGKIASLNTDQSEFVLRDNAGTNWTIHLNKDGKVFLNDKEVKLSDLQVDDEVKITYEKKGEQFMASEVRGTRKK